MNVRATFVLVVIASLVAGWVFLSPMARTPGEKRETPPWFYTASEQDILHITVEAGGQKEAFVRKEKGWFFDTPEVPPVDQSRWGGITLLLSGPQSRRLLAQKVDDPQRYGLDNPQVDIKIQLTGERSVEIVLGARTPDGAAHYAQQAGGEQVFLIDASWGEVLARLATDPPYPTWYYKFNPERIVFLGVEHEGQRVSFTKESEGWRFATEERTPIDPERWKAVEPLLGGPPNFRILKDDIDDLDKYGLKAPTTFMAVEYEPPKTMQEIRRGLELELGSKLADGSGYYARPKGQTYLVFVDASWYDVMVNLATSPPVGPTPTPTPSSG